MDNRILINESVGYVDFFIDENNIVQPLGIRYLGDNRKDLLPPTRDISEEIPGMHGEYDFGTEFKARTLEIHAVTQSGLTPEQKRKLESLIANALDPTSGYKKMMFYDEPELIYYVKYSGKIQPNQYPTFFEFTMPFKTKTPFKIGVAENILIGSGTIINSGTRETGLIIEISGPATNPSLLIGDDTISYTGTISSGSVLAIDTERMTAKIGSSNAIAGLNLSGDFPMLEVGETAVTSSGNISIKWRNRWL